MSTVPTTTDLLNKAILLAVEAHRGQVDKAGDPYILHPLRVMGMVEGLDTKVVAVLHDTIEDTEVTAEVLRELGLPEYLVEAVEAVTRQPDEPYAEFIERVSWNPIGRRVKRADVLDHLRQDSKITLPEGLSTRYTKAIEILDSRIPF